MEGLPISRGLKTLVASMQNPFACAGNTDSITFEAEFHSGQTHRYAHCGHSGVSEMLALNDHAFWWLSLMGIGAPMLPR